MAVGLDKPLLGKNGSKAGNVKVKSAEVLSCARGPLLSDTFGGAPPDFEELVNVL